ncbi:MAG: hypothetical protein L3J20_12485 [Flavobacteriaceae bacterium]|nr:hypothetical protein [Flavobacteriaceae bacterium]
MGYFSVYAQDSNTQILSNQIQETGLPYIQNYTPSDYDAFDQNWSAVQDSLGIMYFANGDGILTYNGVSWGLIELPNQSTVFSLASDEEGRIYVGAIGEIGYLEINSKGQLEYVSLLSKIGKEHFDMGRIRSIHFTEGEVFFTSNTYIFKWDGVKFETWKNSKYSHLFLVNDILFKREEGKGLMEYKNNKFELVAHGGLFSDKMVYAILPYNEDFLVATKDQLYIFDGSFFAEFTTNAPKFFLDNTIYCGVDLKDGTFALGSLKKGILILNHKGEKKVILSQKGLLRSNGDF